MDVSHTNTEYQERALMLTTLTTTALDILTSAIERGIEQRTYLHERKETTFKRHCLLKKNKSTYKQRHRQIFKS